MFIVLHDEKFIVSIVKFIIVEFLSDFIFVEFFIFFIENAFENWDVFQMGGEVFLSLDRFFEHFVIFLFGFDHVESEKGWVVELDSFWVELRVGSP